MEESKEKRQLWMVFAEAIGILYGLALASDKDAAAAAYDKLISFAKIESIPKK